jgi:glycosyltransferase involved in cell wall biosynthesis
MAIAKHHNRDEFKLTICSLREGGFVETAPILASMGVPCFVSPFRPTGRRINDFVTSLRHQKIIKSYGPFDVQHSMDFTSSPFEAVAARLRSRIFLYNQRNLNENGHRTLLKIKAACARRIITNSQAVSDFLTDLGVDSRIIRNISLGLETEPALNGSRTIFQEDPYLLYVGHVEPRKRQQDAIRALAFLAPEFPNLRLLIAGHTVDQKYLHELQRTASELGLEKRVQFLGPRKDIMDLMRNASALMLCSDREAFAWVLLEAMSVDLPVVASAVDGSCQLIQHEQNGLLVQVGDAEDYAKQIRHLLMDPTFAKSLSERARADVERNYSARSMVEKIENVYRELLSCRTSK